MTRRLARLGADAQMSPKRQQEHQYPSSGRSRRSRTAVRRGVRAQLRDLGLGDSGVTVRVRRGGLVPVHRGVLAVGHSMLVVARGLDGRGPRRRAASRAPSRGSRRAVGVRGQPRHHDRHHHSRRRRAGGDARTCASTAPGGFRRPTAKIRERIPVTTPARTILDLAATLNRRALERVLDQAEVLRLADVPALVAGARATTGHPGAPRLLDALDGHAPGTTLARSDLEERFLALCRAAGLPRPLSITRSSVRRSSSSSSISGCSSRPTAGAGTALARSSRPTAAATRSTPPPAGARCASLTTASPSTREGRGDRQRGSEPAEAARERRPARPPRTGRPGTPRLRRRGSGAPRRGTPAARRGPRPRGSGPPGGRPRRTPCARRGTAARGEAGERRAVRGAGVGEA